LCAGMNEPRESSLHTIRRRKFKVLVVIIDPHQGGPIGLPDTPIHGAEFGDIPGYLICQCLSLGVRAAPHSDTLLRLPNAFAIDLSLALPLPAYVCVVIC